jgi:hypothetical protein
MKKDMRNVVLSDSLLLDGPISAVKIYTPNAISNLNCKVSTSRESSYPELDHFKRLIATSKTVVPPIHVVVGVSLGYAAAFKYDFTF